MQAVLVLCLVAVAAASEFYDAKWDDFPLDDLVANPAKFRALGDCITGKGACQSEDIEAKGVFVDAFVNACKKCSPKQRVIFKRALLAYKTKQPEIWADMKASLDPEGKNYPALEHFINSTN